MNLIGRIFEKFSINLTWRNNKKKVIKQEETGLQISQERNSIVNILEIHNLTIPTIENLAGVDTPQNPANLLESVGLRFIAEQRTKQHNLRTIVNKADLRAISNPQTIDKDWFIKWMEISQNTSRESVQDYLAKILAGEIGKPGAFSHRTLEILRTISKTEIELFEKLSGLVIDNKFIIKINGGADFEKFGITFYNLLELREAGLVNEHDNTIKEFKNMKNKKITLNIVNKIISFECPTETVTFQVVVLSNAGAELLQVINRVADKDYTQALRDYLIANNYKLI